MYYTTDKNDISNNISIDLSAYALKPYVDGTLNTINSTTCAQPSGAAGFVTVVGLRGAGGSCPGDLDPIFVPKRRAAGWYLRCELRPRGGSREGLERFRPVRRLGLCLPSMFGACACSCRKASGGLRSHWDLHDWRLAGVPA